MEGSTPPATQIVNTVVTVRLLRSGCGVHPVVSATYRPA
jgi:hypothetical protein